ncbi:ABC transporter permease [Urbifossiella limnaea]|uniref:FtsX-like permease family protein n=1 Tax=Urbifossiella limnaea TaxID=2528023 RepID=A0A517XW82_9BACT|nr:ABC transporter permease [Urbifossiella limnaea]QDU21766.1 FtsX-like permease family protein [Urbifossiella limnaea]
MNLAVRDIRHSPGRFVFTALGIGMLLMIVMGMGGIYRGIVEDATLLVDSVGADLWVVQHGTRGPFAEVSRVPENLADRVAGVPGVASARRFVFHTVQRERDGRPLRVSVTGLDWPTDTGEWLPLVEGRPLGQNHYEMVADRSLRLARGERVKLGKDTYTVVGITSSMISSAGDGLAFFTVPDALAIQFDLPGEAVRLEQAARRRRTGDVDLGAVNPALLDVVSGPSNRIPSLTPPATSAVLVRVAPGADPAAVAAVIAGWSDVSAYDSEQARQLLLSGPVEKSRLQIGLFRVLLSIISAVVMGLILYTMTLDKIPSIALLKLMGASNRVVLWMILQQALILGAVGYGVAYLIGLQLFPRFPRRVVIANDDLLQLAGIVLAISLLSSGLGIWKAARVKPNQALMG